MKSTIRNRAAALGIATAAGLAGIGLASGPALADGAASAAASSADQQSADYPSDTKEYADELVRAWGEDDIIRVKQFASSDAVDTLIDHGNDHGAHWKYTGGESAAGTVYVDYKNTVTGETMSVAVSNVDPADGGRRGEAHAVGNIQFDD